jgi:urease accessory protein UreF
MRSVSAPRFAVTAAICLVGLLLCAWFALSLRQSVATDRATALVQSGNALSASEVKRTRHELHVAGQLNPDRSVTVLGAELAARLGNRRQGERLLDRVVAAEPDNAVAWHDLITVAPDTKTIRRSLLAFARLDPNTF